MKKNEYFKDEKVLNDEELENINGGLEMTFGLPNATEADKKKTKGLVQKGKKKKAGDLILREDSIKRDGPRMC